MMPLVGTEQWDRLFCPSCRCQEVAPSVSTMTTAPPRQPRSLQTQPVWKLETCDGCPHDDTRRIKEDMSMRHSALMAGDLIGSLTRI